MSAMALGIMGQKERSPAKDITAAWDMQEVQQRAQTCRFWRAATMYILLSKTCGIWEILFGMSHLSCVQRSLSMVKLISILRCIASSDLLKPSTCCPKAALKKETWRNCIKAVSTGWVNSTSCSRLLYETEWIWKWRGFVCDEENLKSTFAVKAEG